MTFKQQPILAILALTLLSVSCGKNPSLSSVGSRIPFQNQIPLEPAPPAVVACEFNGLESADDLKYARHYHKSVPLNKDEFLIVGGTWRDADGEIFSEIFNIKDNVSRFTGATTDRRYNPSLIKLSNGQVMVLSGHRSPGSAEIFDPQTESWTKVASLNKPRYGGSAVLLKNGKVLYAGGNVQGKSVEIYDPATNVWTEIASMNHERSNFPLIQSEDGLLYAIAGYKQSAYSRQRSVEVYDPQTNTWTHLGNLPVGLMSFQAKIVGDKIYTIGDSTSIFMFDLSTLTSQAVVSLPNMHYNNVGVLSNGNLVIFGGQSVGSFYEFNPSTATVRKVRDIPGGVSQGSALHVLEDDSVILFGGGTSGGSVSKKSYKICMSPQAANN